MQCGYLWSYQSVGRDVASPARSPQWCSHPESVTLSPGESELRSFWRIFVAELQRGFFEKHVWLSLWDRPPRSRFTRVQRATCCCLLIFLFLCANAVWYGMVGNIHLRCVHGVVGSVHLRCVPSQSQPAQGPPACPIGAGHIFHPLGRASLLVP